MRKTTRAVVVGLVMAVSLLLTVKTRAGSDTWMGTVSANWNATNWSGVHNPPATGDSLIFTSTTGAGGTALNNNLTSGSFDVAGITYNSGAAAFTVSGNAFVLTGSITNNGSNLETISDAFSITSAENFVVASGSLTLGGSISGTGGGLTIGGSDTVTLSGANSYSGATTVNGGKLLLNNASALSPLTTLTVNNGGIVDLNGNNASITDFGAGGLLGFITNGASGTTANTITVTNLNIGLNTRIANGATRPVAVKLQSIGSINSGSLNNNTNTFSGGLTLGNATSGSGYMRLSLTTAPVNQGVAGNITSSIFGRGSITIGNSASDNAQIYITANNTVILNPIVFNTSLGADRVGALRIESSGLVLAGTLTANSAPVNMSVNFVYSGYSAFLTGQITGSEGLWLQSNPQSTNAFLTCVLSNVTANANNYQGVTEIDPPFILVLGAANQIPTGASYVTNNGTLQLNGNSATISGLWGSGVVDGISGTPTLTVGNNNATSTFTGVIQNTSGTLSLAKVGAGTVTLSGANSYSGATTVKAGTLVVPVGSSLANSAVTVSATSGNSAVLDVSVANTGEQWTCPSLTVNNGGSSSGLQFDFGSMTPSTTVAPLKITGNVTFSTPPVITVNGSAVSASSGYGYPLLTWGSGSAPDLTGVTVNLSDTQCVGRLAIVGNTLYLHSILIPNAVAGKGYSLIWHDEFDSLTSIDLNNTQTNGYTWYVQAPYSKATAAWCFTNVQPSVLRMLGGSGSNENEQLVSSVSMTTGYNLPGTNGFYIEASMRFPVITTNTSAGWPAFWLRPSENSYSQAPWPGLTNGWQNATEIDVMEYYGATYYGGTLHDWYGLNTGTNRFFGTNSLENHVYYTNGEPPTNAWHIYGCLVVPSTSPSATNGFGFCQMFLDNVATTNFNKWLSPTNLYTTVTNPVPTGYQVFSSIELWHSIISLGTAFTNLPIDVDWVRVWCTSTNGEQQDAVLLRNASPPNASLPNPTPNIATKLNGGQLTISWPNNYTGWLLQVQTNSLSVGLGTNWQTVTGSDGTNEMTFIINPANPATFYRLVSP